MDNDISTTTELCRHDTVSLEDLLDDDIMEPVLRSAGVDRDELLDLMVETARRIDETSEVGSDP